jgi:hypothetical protein
MRIQNSLVAALVLLLAGPFAAPGTADAQILKRVMKRAEKKVEQRVERKADRAVDKTLDKTEAGLTCVVTDADCIAKAKHDGRDVVLTDDKGARVAPPAPAPAASGEAARIEGVPAWVPLPRDYAVNLNTGGASMRSVVLEFADDVRAMVARFNAELAAAGHGKNALEEQPAEDGLYRAGGIVVSDEGTVIIQIGEYAPGGARVAGNLGSVSYQLVK